LLPDLDCSVVAEQLVDPSLLGRLEYQAERSHAIREVARHTRCALLIGCGERRFDEVDDVRGAEPIGLLRRSCSRKLGRDLRRSPNQAIGPVRAV
jgi:hypothetical protein